MKGFGAGVRELSGADHAKNKDFCSTFCTFSLEVDVPQYDIGISRLFFDEMI